MMDRYYFLLLGTAIPYKHLNKIVRKFNNYYERASPERQQQFVEIVPEYHIRRFYDPLPYSMQMTGVMVEPAYLNRFLEIISRLNFTFILCHYRHGHLETTLDGIEYRVTSYRSLEDVVYLTFEYEEEIDGRFADKLLTLPLEKQVASAPGIKTREEYQHLLDTWVREVLAYPAKNA
ncbi:hypothetical protein [Brevibacillus sp. 179-C9.3 HS]|uniref:hypothetical protein n=1 Tax=unclassified Brevibacillus TaxID=2684853 RepID=UPI0039A21AF0